MTSRRWHWAVRNSTPYLLCPILVATQSCEKSSATAPSSAVKTCAVTSVSLFVNAGDTLRMYFTLPANANADVLSYEVSRLPSPIVPGPSESCQLFDGDRLLGTDGACAGGWQSSTASVRLSRLPQIDFSTIAAGTLAGRIDFVVTGGSWAFDGKGTVGLWRTTLAESGPVTTLVTTTTTSSSQLIGPSCR